MTTRRGIVTLGALLLLPCGFQASTAAAESSGPEPLAVVVAKNSSVNSISLYKLKRLYMGDALNAPDGKKLRALNRGSRTSERVSFDKTVLGMSPDKAARYWVDRRIRGRSRPPKAVDPANMLQKVISRLPGAISYVRLTQVSKEMKVVRIDGKLPSDTGYPILAAGGG